MSLVNDKLFDVNSIKPKEIDEYIHHEHLQMSNRRIFKNICPACFNDEYNFAFDKYNFHYVQCTKCMSFYVQNPVSKEDLNIYNKNLEEKIYKSDKYLKYLNQLIESNSFDIELIFSRIFGNQQNIKIAYVGSKALVFQKALAKFDILFENFKELNEQEALYDFIIIDHALEKLDNASFFLETAAHSLKKGGFLYILARVGSGIDILTLWENSKIYPLEHQNLLSTEGLKILLENKDFTVKEMNTPGTLDIDNILKNNNSKIPKFLEYLKLFEKERALEDFRVFIQKNLLSSFATIIAKKD